MVEIQVVIEAMEMLAIGPDPCSNHQFMRGVIHGLEVLLSLAHHVSMEILDVKAVRGVTILDPQFVDSLIVRPEAGKYFDFVSPFVYNLRTASKHGSFTNTACVLSK